ncbi:MAG: exosome complex RNA-binding protein Rrp4 [Desulfurococcaceae archaeon]
MKILVADKQLVKPGDCLALLEKEEVQPEQGLKHIPDKHIYIYGDRVYSDIMGVASVEDKSISVIPLEGVYIPHKEDNVIGLVVGVGLSNWIVDIKAPYKAVLPASDVIEGFTPSTHNLRNYLDVGDFIYARIVAYDRLRDPLLTIRGKGLGKIIEGFVIDVKPSKVGRIIGKKGSMFNVLASSTACEISIGLNGYVWAKCPDESTLSILIKAIRLIETKAHMKGLTEEVKMFIESQLGVKREK